MNCLIPMICVRHLQEMHSDRDTYAHPGGLTGALVTKAGESVIVLSSECNLFCTVLKFCAVDHKQGVADVAIYGRVATMELFRPPVRSLKCSLHQDLLIIMLSYGKRDGL